MPRVRSRIAGQIRLDEENVLTMVDLDEALFTMEAVLDFKAVITRREGKDFFILKQSACKPIEMKSCPESELF